MEEGAEGVAPIHTNPQPTMPGDGTSCATLQKAAQSTGNSRHECPSLYHSGTAHPRQSTFAESLGCHFDTRHKEVALLCEEKVMYIL